MSLRIYDTLSQELKEFVPLRDTEVTFYVCGPTVYDYSHLGHARCYITWDVVYRYLTFLGYKVHYVRNITDIDDKIIKRSEVLSLSAQEVSDKNTVEFHYDMAALNILSPTYEPRATDHVLEIQEFIQGLLQKGFAYESGRDIYFSPISYTEYGLLSKQKREDLIENSRVDHNDLKKDQTDFVLWKSTQENDLPNWFSPWGYGRPGWHIECNSMIMKHLGNSIDIHAGGCDLIFPHHENERALAESLTGEQFVNCWMHNGFVNVDEEKMSKSLGNFKTIRELMKYYSSDAIRYFILTNHYRMPVNFSDEALTAASNGINNLIKSFEKYTALLSSFQENPEVSRLKEVIDSLVTGTFKGHAINSLENNALIGHISKFKAFMDDDFNTSGAMSVLFELSAQLKSSETPQEIYQYGYLIKTFSTLLGFRMEKSNLSSSTQSQDTIGVTESLMDLIIHIRQKARENKDWETSDQIRSKLSEIGISLKDSKEGVTTWINS